MAGKAEPVRVIVLAAAMLWCCAARCAAGGRGDILIVAHPERLTVYNTYQQRLSRDEGQALAAFEPMLIVREKDLLGDGFTPCMRVRARGEALYLLAGPDGALVESGGTAGVTLLRDVRMLEDTIVVRAPSGLTVRSFDGRATYRAAAGELLVRDFLDNEKTYVRFPSAPSHVGWVTLAAGEWARHRVAKEASVGAIAALLPALRTIVHDANAALRSMYARFRADSPAASPAPQFLLDERADTLLCTLQPAGRARAFHESIIVLSRTLEGVFAEGDVRVEVAGNTIRIVQL